MSLLPCLFGVLCAVCCALWAVLWPAWFVHVEGTRRLPPVCAVCAGERTVFDVLNRPCLPASASAPCRPPPLPLTDATARSE